MSLAQQVEEVSIRLTFEPTCKHIPIGSGGHVSPVFSDKVPTMVTFFATVPVAVCQGEDPEAIFPVEGTPGHDVIPAGNKIRTMVSTGCKFAAVSQTSGVLYLNDEGAV